MKILRNIKRTLLAALCSTATTVVMADSEDLLNDDQTYGQPLKTTDSVITALNSGAIVNAVVDLSKCARQDGEDALKLRGGLLVSPYQIKEDGTLLFVGSVYTATTFFSGNLEPIADFTKYSVSPKGAITVSAYIYSIPDYTLISEIIFDCSINNGVSFNAAY
jgi:hypothetical protein